MPCPAPNGADTCDDWVTPMSFDPDYHDTDAEDPLRGVPAQPDHPAADQTGDQDLNVAIDAIFHHPNVGPVPRARADPQPGHLEPVARLRRARRRLLQRQRLGRARQASGRWSRRSSSTRRRATAADRSDLRAPARSRCSTSTTCCAPSTPCRPTARTQSDGHLETTSSGRSGQNVFWAADGLLLLPAVLHRRRRPRPGSSAPSSGS